MKNVERVEDLVYFLKKKKIKFIRTGMKASTDCSNENNAIFILFKFNQRLNDLDL